jgi:hypothetical protein
MKKTTWYGACVPVLALTLSASSASAQQAPAVLATPSIDELKRAYLECDRVATVAVLVPSAAATCSIVAETLQSRGFDGSFDRLLAWWRAEKSLANTSQKTPGTQQ